MILKVMKDGYWRSQSVTDLETGEDLVIMTCSIRSSCPYRSFATVRRLVDSKAEPVTVRTLGIKGDPTKADGSLEE